MFLRLKKSVAKRQSENRQRKDIKFTETGYNSDKQADAVQNVLVWAFDNLKRLASKGRLHEVYAGSLARFAIGRHWALLAVRELERKAL